eukprot:824355-Amphidinium_carterae.2
MTRTGIGQKACPDASATTTPHGCISTAASGAGNGQLTASARNAITQSVHTTQHSFRDVCTGTEATTTLMAG